MYLRDFGEEPSFGNLHLSTYLSPPKKQNPKKIRERGEVTKSLKNQLKKQDILLNSTYLAVGPSQFLAFPSFTE